MVSKFQPSEHHQELTPLLQNSQEPKVNVNKSSMYVRESKEAFYLKVALMLSAGIALVIVGLLSNKIADDIKSPPGPALTGIATTIGILAAGAGFYLTYKGMKRAEKGPAMVRNKQYEPPPPEPLKYDEIEGHWEQSKSFKELAEKRYDDEKAFLFAERQRALGALKLYMEEPTEEYEALAKFEMDKLVKNPKIFDSEPRVVSTAQLLSTFRNVKTPKELERPKEAESSKPFDYDLLGVIDIDEGIEMQDMRKIGSSNSLDSLIDTFEKLDQMMTGKRMQDVFLRENLLRSGSYKPELHGQLIKQYNDSIQLIDRNKAKLQEVIQELRTNEHANLQELDNMLDKILENVGTIAYDAVADSWYSWRLDTLLEEVTKSAKEMPDLAMRKWQDAKDLADRYQIPNARAKLEAAKKQIPTDRTDWWRQPGEL